MRSLLFMLVTLICASSFAQTKVLLTCQQKRDSLQVSDDGLGYIRIRRTIVDSPTYVNLGPQPNTPMYFRTADTLSYDAIIDGSAVVGMNQLQITATNKSTLTLRVSRPVEGEAVLTVSSSDAYLMPAVMSQLQAAGQSDFDYFVGDCSFTP